MKNDGKYVSVRVLKIFLAYAESQKIDCGKVLTLSGIEPDRLRDNNARIGTDQLESVFSAIIDRLGGIISGICLAEKINNQYNNNHILMTIMANCPDLENAVEKLIQYHDISSNSIRLFLERGKESTSLIWKSELKTHPEADRIFTEAALTSCALLFRDLTSGRLKFTDIHFAFPAPPDLKEYRRIFDCPILFDSNEYKIVFSREDLSLPIALSDPELLKVLEIHAQKLLSIGRSGNLFSEKLADCLSEMIVQGKECSIADVAQKMCLGIRSLQKKLQMENTSFRKLLEQVRKDIAIKSLDQSGTTLADTAFLLGFSEQSAFNHAFKKWTGVSPGKYKNNA